MKKTIFLSLVYMISSFSLYAQTDQVPYREDIKKFLAEKKYSSAFRFLVEKDPLCANPDIQMMKLDLAMTYFVKSDNHVSFGLTDLPADQTIESLRSTDAKADIYPFDVARVFAGLIKTSPADWRLRRSLGLYYFEVSHRFRGGWMQPDEEVVRLYDENLGAAYQNGLYDSVTLYALGEGRILNAKYDESLVFLGKSRDMNPEFPAVWYALAWSYLNLHRPKDGIPCIEKAVTLYAQPAEKAGATLVLGALFEEGGDNERAFTAYHSADVINPGSYEILKNLIRMSLVLKKNDETRKSTESFFNIAPENPLIYQDLVNMYSADKSLETLNVFFEERKTANAANQVVLGNLFFYTGSIHYLQGRMDKCRADMVRSREIFAVAYPPEHQVFKVIDATIADCDNKKNGTPEKPAE